MSSKLEHSFFADDIKSLLSENHKTEDIKLNNYIFQYGTVTLMVGVTGVGKTEMALDFLFDHLRLGTSIYIAYEGTKYELVERLRRKFQTQDEFEKHINKLVFMLNPTVDEIKHVISNIKGKCFVCLDYLQQMARYLLLERNERMLVLVNSIVRLFSSFRENGEVIVFLISNMTKGSISELSKEDNLEPLILLGSVKESGDVVYDMDSVFALCYNDNGKVKLGRYDREGIARKEIVLYTLKQFRIQGKLGVNPIKLNYIFNPMESRFEEIV